MKNSNRPQVVRTNIIAPRSLRYIVIVSAKCGSSTVKWRSWAIESELQRFYQARQLNYGVLSLPDQKDIFGTNNPKAFGCDDSPFLSQEQSLAAIANTQIPIFVVLRDPISRLISVYKEKLFNAGRNTTDHPQYDGTSLSQDPHYLHFCELNGLPSDTQVSLSQFCECLDVNESCLLADVHWAPQRDLITENLLSYLDRYRPDTKYFEVAHLDEMYLRLLNLHYAELFEDNPNITNQILKRVDVHSYASLQMDITQDEKEIAARIYAADYELVKRSRSI